MTPWARVAVVSFALFSAAGAAVNLAISSRWAAYFHGLRVMLHSLGAGTTHPPVPQPPLWSSLFLPFTLAAQILFLIWQSRAATTARSLGFPARRSPGVGVASYFIPVIQLWFPYQALRDCLPPGHESRRLVLGAWLVLVIASFLNAALIFALAETHAFGVVIGAFVIALDIVLARLGYQVVDAISAEHRNLTSPS